MNCLKCKGNTRSVYSCGKPFCPILQKFKNAFPKIEHNFSGSSPPDLFVGQYNYPYVYTGILAPAEHVHNANELSSPEHWFDKKLSISNILENRGRLIYSRFTTNVKKQPGKLLNVMQEVSMSKQPCDIEFFLAKKPKTELSLSYRLAPIGNPAPLINARIESNPKIDNKVDYIVSDTDLKSVEAIKLLHQYKFDTSTIIKLLSAGLLGFKHQRKLVPSRWSVTAVDDTISKHLMNRIKDYKVINEFRVYNEEYLGNHYEILFLPKPWLFEVIEAKLPGSCWNHDTIPYLVQDYEDNFRRKTYAANVSGAYYSCRLAVTEHLSNLKRQASVLVLREVSKDYYAPCGVGILRELVRSAMRKKPELFNTLESALNRISSRLKIPIHDFIQKSKLLEVIKKQKSLFDFQ